MNESISYATAAARLVVSYGMSDIGAQRLLEAAGRDGIARTAAVTVTCNRIYPPEFTVQPA